MFALFAERSQAKILILIQQVRPIYLGLRLAKTTVAQHTNRWRQMYKGQGVKALIFFVALYFNCFKEWLCEAKHVGSWC